MVDDIMEEDRKFRKTLDELIKKHDIKIDLDALEQERARHAKKDLRKIKIEKRNKLIARIEKQMTELEQPEPSRYEQKTSSHNSRATLPSGENKQTEIVQNEHIFS